MMARTVVKLTPKLHHLVGIWWAVFWRAFLWGILVNLPLALLFALVHGGTYREWAIPHFVLGNAVYFVACLWAIRAVLRKGFDEYEIWLVARDPERRSPDL